MGCAKDIVEYYGVPRFLFSDFPLGNAAGRPKDPQSQAFTLELALRVLETARAPRTTVQSPLRWASDRSWKLDYSNIERLSPEEIRRRRDEFDQQKEIAKTVRDKPRASQCPPFPVGPGIALACGTNFRVILDNLERLTLSGIEVGPGRPIDLDRSIFRLNCRRERGTLS
jgi:hypothetical protein